MILLGLLSLQGFFVTLLHRRGIGSLLGRTGDPCIYGVGWRVTQQTLQTQHPQGGLTANTPDSNPRPPRVHAVATGGG
jgi:hypothetical protein